jgi:hypothetical protein
MTRCKPPVRPAPPGFRWLYVKSYRHYKTGKVMVATDYGYVAWRFLVRSR